MPQERDSQFPFPTAADVAATPGTREQKAARNIAVRHIQGIPRRAFLLGDADHASMMKGIVDLADGVYRLLDLIEEQDEVDLMSSKTRHAMDVLHKMLEDHGCQ